MKFSCPKCSAKYQIADEKVAGKTVKMKCRKCGTTIPIRAEPSRQELARAPLVRADSLKPRPPRRAGATGAATAAAMEAPVPDIAPAPASIEWHAGIDGKAVGPMSIREVERRMGEGSIHQDTFVWHEGMDGWKQVPDVPELALILTKSIKPLTAPPPSMPMQAKAQRLAPAVVSPTAPQPLHAPAAKVTTQPVASHPIINEPTSRPAVMGSAALATQARAESAPILAVPAPTPASGPTPAVAKEPLTTPEAPIPQIDMPPEEFGKPSYESLMMQLQKTRRQHPLVVPFAVLAAVVLGVTIGFVLFGDQETKIVKQVVEVPAKAEEKSTEAAAKEEDKAESETDSGEDTAASDAPAAVAKGSSPNGATKSSETSTKPAEVKGLSGLSGLDGLGGPSSGPSGPGSSSGSGRQLTSSQIQSTVSKYQTSVKRGCWERALMSRDKDAPSSARVTVAISVAPSGSVTRASASPDPRGYTGLSSCITRRVQGWQFPASGGSTTVNVPFVFAAQ